MKRFVLCLTLILSLASFASACDHVAPAVAAAGGYCANCAAQYNQAVGATAYGAIPNSYTKTTVTETVTQPATSGLQVSAEYVTPTTTVLAPAATAAPAPPGFIVGTYQPPAYYGYSGAGNYGTFGAGGYRGHNFGSFHGNSFGVFSVGHRNNFGNFGSFNGHRNFGNFGATQHRNFGAGGHPVNNRNFNGQGQQVNGNGKVQALPRLRNAVNALRGR